VRVRGFEKNATTKGGGEGESANRMQGKMCALLTQPE